MEIVDASQSGSLLNVRQALAAFTDPANVGIAVSSTRDAESGYTSLHFSSANNDVAVLELLLSHCKNEEVVAASTGVQHRSQTILHVAASRGSAETCQLIATRFPSLIATVNDWSETPIALAAAANALDAVKMLLMSDPGRKAALIQDKWGRTAHQVALQHGYLEVAALFPDVATLSPPPPPPPVTPAAPPPPAAALVSAQSSITSAAVTSELMTALSKRNQRITEPSTIVRNIFSAHTEPLARPTAPQPTSAQAPKRKAISSQIEFPATESHVSSLVADPAHFDPDGRDMYGFTALHKLASWNQVDILSLLLPHTDPNARTLEGFTALHCAIDAGAVDALSALKQDPRVDLDNVRDTKGRSGREFAKEMGFEAYLN
ncbi:ankyrin repeat-containing domain protein [Chytriomyces sp. MP71]|nr:ankyrin repeat-containing domain protein [Chytriomyces sp. MP71]